VYAAGAVGGAGAVFLTEDFGLSWKRARQAPAGPVLDLAVSPGDAGRLLAATAAGAYLSTDAGETWARVCTVPGLRQVEFHPAGADTMAAAGRHGVALSTDAGATWQDLSAGLPTTDVHALAFADCGGTSLLAGTRGEACFRWDFPTAEDEPQPAACRPRPGATVTTDELNLPWAGTAEGRATTTMLDACGREVLSLRPGPNDISLLPAGVYVLRDAGAGAGLRRVVVLR